MSAETFPKKKKKSSENTNTFPKKETHSTDCPHKNFIEENYFRVCVDCGEQFKSEKDIYSEFDFKSMDRCHYRNIPEKGIKKELTSLGFPNDISTEADQLYMKITNGEIKRSNLRKGIMFACVFDIYKCRGEPQIPEVLQAKFKLDRKNMSKGITYFHIRNPNKNNITYITVEHFIPCIMEKLNIKNDHVPRVLELYDKIKFSSSILVRSNPQSVSSSLVYYYLKKLVPDLQLSSFSKIVNLSDITIMKIVSEIEEALGE
jgi:transcription initiation factor TFIIIB Brf1 subunit/transcription initiation factor TFIIB